MDRNHTHRSDLNLLGLFLAACGKQESDRDDEHNLFHRGTSFNRREVSYELSLPPIPWEDVARHKPGFRDWLARQYFPHDLRQEPSGRLASPQFPIHRISAAAQ